MYHNCYYFLTALYCTRRSVGSVPAQSKVTQVARRPASWLSLFRPCGEEQEEDRRRRDAGLWSLWLAVCSSTSSWPATRGQVEIFRSKTHRYGSKYDLSSAVEPAPARFFFYGAGQNAPGGSGRLLCDLGVLWWQSCDNSCNFSQILTFLQKNRYRTLFKK